MTTMSITQTLLRSPVVAALTSPHGVDRYLELVNPMWAAHEVRARVVDTHREVDVPGHPPVTTLTLQPTSTWAGHAAGQHVQVGVEIDGARRTTRVFSISSAASGPGERFTITLRANPDGVVSRFLAEHARPGALLHLSQAQGEFVLPDHVPVTFLHYAQSPAHQIFAEELAAVRRSGYGVDVHLLHPELGDPALSPAYLERLLPGYRDVPTWACGPAPLTDAVQKAYTGSDQLRLEYFKVPRVAGWDAEGEVAFTRSGTAGANTGATLLEQAEALGLEPEYGCRMGICFSCTSRKTEGTVRNVVTGRESSLPDEDIQICVSQPVGDCAVEL
jgi:ferredoxin-NADP reductase